MATKLPSSGSVPDREPAGCDTSGLIIVHRVFRWLYRELPILIREVEPGDVDRATLVGGYAKLAFFALHMHHETEDTVLWDRMTSRQPACIAHVDQMRAQHAEVAAHLARIESQLASWMTAADAGLRDTFATDIEAVHGLLTTHLGQEEDDILPFAGEVLSQDEWNEMEVHARTTLMAHRKELPRNVMSLQLGLILASVPEADRDEWFRTNVPAPIRLLYVLLMKRQYEAAVRELYPDRPAPTLV